MLSVGWCEGKLREEVEKCRSGRAEKAPQVSMFNVRRGLCRAAAVLPVAADQLNSLRSKIISNVNRTESSTNGLYHNLMCFQSGLSCKMFPADRLSPSDSIGATFSSSDAHGGFLSLCL